MRGKKTESPCIFKANKIREDNRLKNGSKSVKKVLLTKFTLTGFINNKSTNLERVYLLSKKHQFLSDNC